MVIVAPAAGCQRSVDGAPRAHRVDTALVDLVLPTVAEASKAVDQPLQPPENDTPFHGGPDILFPGARGDKDIDPIECESTVSVFTDTTFAGSSLIAAARVLYYTAHRGQSVFSADATSFQFASPEDARRMLSSLVEHWTRCSGKTVTINIGNDSKELVAVSNVAATGTLLSENTVRRRFDHLPERRPWPAQRAISVVSNLIVVATVDMDVDYGPPAPVGDRAITLVKLMASKIDGRV